MKAKEQVGADIYVEDTPQNVTNLRSKRLYTICFGNSTKRDVEAPRVSSWEEVYQLIHERSPP